MKTILGYVTICCALALLAGPALASDKQAEGAMEDVQEAARVIQKMKKDAGISALLRDAKGVLVVPDYAAAALIAGGSGGQGVLVEHRGGQWSDPVFYNIGGASIGLQAGVSVGSIAMLLMSDQAVNSFKGDNNIELNAQAGLTIGSWSNRAEGEVGAGTDVIVWTDTEGGLGELSLGFTDVSWDKETNQKYYGEMATAQAILDGDLNNPHAKPLQQELDSLGKAYGTQKPKQPEEKTDRESGTSNHKKW